MQNNRRTLVQDAEDTAVSRAESEDMESVDTMSEAGGSPVSSMTGGGGSFWPAPIRIGIGGLRAHGAFRKRSSGAGSFSALRTATRNPTSTLLSPCRV